MTVDEIVKLALGLVLAISILGIAIQLMRLLGTFNGMLQDVRYLGYEVAGVIKKLTEDYEKLRSSIDSINSSISDIDSGFLKPVTRLTRTIGALADVASEKLLGKTRSS